MAGGSGYYFPTTIDKFLRCPFQFKQYRTAKHLIPKWVHRESTWIGDVVHYFMEMLFREGQGASSDFQRLWDKAWRGHLQHKIPGAGFWTSEEHEARVSKSSLFTVTNFLQEHPQLFGLEVVGAEMWCHADYMNLPLGIRADLICRYPSGIITILDWKSGEEPFFKTLPKFMANDSQMPVSALVAAKQFSCEAPMVEIFWVFADFEHRAQFDAASLAGWETHYRKIIMRIEATSEWTPVKNKLCDWCDFQCSSCPLFDDKGQPV